MKFASTVCVWADCSVLVTLMQTADCSNHCALKGWKLFVPFRSIDRSCNSLLYEAQSSN
jgi:hypothetical protein